MISSHSKRGSRIVGIMCRAYEEYYYACCFGSDFICICMILFLIIILFYFLKAFFLMDFDQCIFFERVAGI